MNRTDKRIISCILAVLLTVSAAFSAFADSPRIDSPVAPSPAAAPSQNASGSYTPGANYGNGTLSSPLAYIPSASHVPSAYDPDIAYKALADSIVDVAGANAAAIFRSASLGLVNISNEKEARPNDDITKGELAYSIYHWFLAYDNLLKAVGASYPAYSGVYNDVKFTTPYYDEITFVAKKGVMSGVGANFNPTAAVTRQEAARVWTNVFSGLYASTVSPAYIGALNIESRLNRFTDRTSITTINHRGVAFMCDQGYMGAYGENAAFLPNRPMSRGEMYALIDSFNIYPRGGASAAPVERAVTLDYSFSPTPAYGSYNPYASYNPYPSYYPYGSYNPYYPGIASIATLNTRNWRYDGFTIDVGVTNAQYLSDDAFVKVYITQDRFDSGFYDALYGTGVGAATMPRLSQTENYRLGDVTTYIYQLNVNAPGRWYVYAAVYDYGYMGPYLTAEALCEVNPSYSYPATYAPTVSRAPSQSALASAAPSSQAPPSTSAGGSESAAPSGSMPSNSATPGESANVSAGASIAASESAVASESAGDIDSVITSKIVAISSNLNHTLALDADGAVWAWGDNASGQLGDGKFVSHYSPAKVHIPAPYKIKAIAAGEAYSVALDTEGRLWVWGDAAYGALGIGTETTRKINSPTRHSLLPYGKKAVSITAGCKHTIVIDEDGTLWACGFNIDGQLGLGDETDRVVFTRIGFNFGDKIKSVSAGAYYTLALGTNGKLWGWGQNGHAMIGGDTIDNVDSPVNIPFPTAVTPAALGSISRSFTSFAIDGTGALWAWGASYIGQMGDGVSRVSTLPEMTVTQPSMPPNPNSVKIKSIASGWDQTVAIDTGGEIWVWGLTDVRDEAAHQVDTEYLFYVSPPSKRALPNGKKAAVVAVGGSGRVCYAIDTDGALYSWGYNIDGMLGNGDIDETYITTPSKI